ncbi:MAG: NACHT domain-containing protein, partial [Anaerolineales bacterium]|nr:NACHT domain-containing protein [Anaerolineales bacterium]
MTPANLRDLLDQHFNDAELRQLCFDLTVEYENLPGDTRLAKAQALVQHCLRHNRLPELADRCRELRPTTTWPDVAELAGEWAKIQAAITAQEGLQGILTADQLAAALIPLRQKEADLLVAISGPTAITHAGVVAQGNDAIAVGERGVNVGGDVGGDLTTGQKVVVTVESGATLVMNNADQLADTPALDRDSAVDRYLAHVIAHNRYLQLQGVRSGGRLVHIELEQIYITLRATQQRTVSAEERWLAQEAQLAPGERRRPHFATPETVTQVVTVSVNEALAGHRRLVVLGDPGSGKTTLLRYLALIYARDKAGSNHDRGDSAGPIRRLLGLPERGCLPILLPLRQIGTFLKDHSEESTEGPRLLLEFLRRYLANERIDVPLNFFDPYLAQGQAVILLDGLDEVPGADLRRRVARLVERFTQAYPACRYVVTSRIVGYEGAARLGEGYTTTTVQEFSLADVEQFLRYWHRLVWIGQMGPGPIAEHEAERQTAQLLAAIRGNERIRELAINPLMLTVIALVHRDRVKLPDRRAEL